MGVMKVESSFNPKAISKGSDGFTPVAYGLMQVIRSTAQPILKNMGKTWTTELALQPEFSMEVGVFHLMDLHRRFVIKGIEEKNEFHLSLIAYNRGEQLVLDAVDMSKKVPVSLDYLGKVKIASKKWRKFEF
jgi:soluble lytic murein transglycosylase-like protein